jgi:hypothetical protein
MKMPKSVLLFAILAVAAAGTAACSDTGDNSSSPDSGGDGTVTGDDSAVGVDTGNGVDSTTPGDDSSAPEASADTGTTADTGSTDSSQSDSTVDTGAPESGSDTGTEDAQADVTVDVSNPDTGTPDTGTPDTGTPDTGTPDTGTQDSGTEAGNDAGIAALNAHCATNNGGAPCTATELLLIEHDTNPDGTAKGDAAQAFACYDCMENAGCIDDSVFASDVDHECGDTGGTGITMPTLHGDSATTACLNVVSCILSHPTCTGSNGSGTCYCGTAIGSACTMAGMPNGPCLAQEEDGLDTTDPTAANNHFTNIAYAGGMANTLFSCAGSNNCTTCYQ